MLRTPSRHHCPLFNQRSVPKFGLTASLTRPLVQPAGLRTLPHPETTIDDVSHEGYETGALALQASAALELRLAGGLALGAEYKFTRTSQSITIDRGLARGTFASHHGVFGVAWHSR